jgi:hypothetical protein
VAIPQPAAAIPAANAIIPTCDGSVMVSQSSVN